VGCWRSYLSGVRYRLAYGPADAIATQSLGSVKSRLVLPFWYRLTRVVQEKGPLNGSVCVCVRACVRACVCARVRVRACVCVCVCALQGGPVRCYKDSLKMNLRACDLAPSVLRTAPLDRCVWTQCCSNAISRGTQQLLSPSGRPGRTLLLQEGR